LGLWGIRQHGTGENGTMRSFVSFTSICMIYYVYIKDDWMTGYRKAIGEKRNKYRTLVVEF